MAVLKENGMWNSTYFSNLVYPEKRELITRYINGKPITRYKDEWNKINDHRLKEYYSINSEKEINHE